MRQCAYSTCLCRKQDLDRGRQAVACNLFMHSTVTVLHMLGDDTCLRIVAQHCQAAEAEACIYMTDHAQR